MSPITQAALVARSRTATRTAPRRPARGPSRAELLVSADFMLRFCGARTTPRAPPTCPRRPGRSSTWPSYSPTSSPRSARDSTVCGFVHAITHGGRLGRGAIARERLALAAGGLRGALSGRARRGAVGGRGRGHTVGPTRGGPYACQARTKSCCQGQGAGDDALGYQDTKPLVTIRGVDVTVAMSITAAVGDFQRFCSPNELVSYL